MTSRRITVPCNSTDKPRLAKLFSNCDWYSKYDSSTGFEISPNEVYQKQVPNLLTLTTTREYGAPSWEKDLSTLLSRIERMPRAELYEAYLSGSSESGRAEGTLAGLLRAFEMDCLSVSNSGFKDSIDGFARYAVPFVGNCRIGLVKVAHSLNMRWASLRCLMARETTPAYFQSQTKVGEAGFNGANGLQLTDKFFLGPLLMLPCLLISPWLVGNITSRNGRDYILCLFEKPVLVGGEESLGVLDFLRPSGYNDRPVLRSTAEPNVGQDDIQSLFEFWVERCNVFLSVLFDPTLHDESGSYSVKKHFLYFLSVQRMLAIAQDLLCASYTDRIGPLLKTFSLLDLAEGIGRPDFTATTKSSLLRVRLQALKDDTPQDLHKVLFAKVEAAIAELTEIESNFFGTSQRTEEDVPRLLRAIRNGHHSFTSLGSPAHSDKLERLLEHDGKLGVDLFGLGLLLVLELVLEPHLPFGRHFRGQPAFS